MAVYKTAAAIGICLASGLSGSGLEEPCQGAKVLAIDMGSGKTKATLAVVDQNQRIVKVIWSTFVKVKYSDDLAVSPNQELSVRIQEDGIKALKELKSRAVKDGATGFSLVATEVFRKAQNGALYLKRINKELDIPAKLISQDQEADLGFTTGSAITGISKDQLLVLDHGSGSFQVSAQDNHSLVSINGQLGTIPLAKALIEKIQNKTYQAGMAPDPVTKEEAGAFIRYIHETLGNQPEWLKKKLSSSGVMAAGLGDPIGSHGICAKITGKKRFSQEELWSAIDQKLLNRSDLEVQKVYPEAADPTLIPRALFVYGLMVWLDVSQLNWAESNGCTEGMLVTPELWQLQSKL